MVHFVSKDKALIKMRQEARRVGTEAPAVLNKAVITAASFRGPSDNVTNLHRTTYLALALDRQAITQNERQR